MEDPEILGYRYLSFEMLGKFKKSNDSSFNSYFFLSAKSASISVLSTSISEG